MNAPELISRAIDDVLNSSVKLADVLLKVKALAYMLKEEQLKEWVNVEIEGYQGTDKPVPDYRIVGVSPRVYLINKVHGHQMPSEPMTIDYLDKDFQEALTHRAIPNGIAEVEDMATNGKDRHLNLPHPIIAIIQKDVYRADWHIHRAWQVLPANQLAGVLTSIKSKVIDLLFALQGLGDDITLRAFQPAVNDTVAKVLQSIQVANGGVVNFAQGTNSVQATNTGSHSSFNAASGSDIDQSTE